jgi:hypothetical protein
LILIIFFGLDILCRQFRREDLYQDTGHWYIECNWQYL